MLTQLRIQNFKGWQDTGPLRMAPLTLFFGANSSGKSSIGQFLMLLKQTAESPDRRIIFYPGSKNSVVQLGSYNEMVFNRDSDRNIQFSYEWEMMFTDSEGKFKDSIIKDSITGKNFAYNLITFNALVGHNESDKQTLSVKKMNYELKRASQPILSIGMNSNSKKGYDVSCSYYSLVRNQGRARSLGPPIRFYGFSEEVVAKHQNADFVQDINLQHERLFHSIYYLGPLRTKAERLYIWRGNEHESVGYTGENTVPAILAANSRRLSFKEKGRTKPFEEIIAMKLKEMYLIEDFKVRAISEGRQEYEVKVKTKGARDFVDLPDVGFGISQVLPILVQCFYAPANSIIIMEQPEIHLHPIAQSVLADVIIDVVHSREYNADRDRTFARNIQLIIETHSEHFLRRLQRRIAENKIEQEKVAAYFANVSKYPATLDPLKIDLFGNISNWPKNFFGDEMEDIIGHSEAVIKKNLDKNT